MKIFGILMVLTALAAGVWWYSQEAKVITVEDSFVVIIGAGAAGLTAGFELEQAGVEYVILEASDTYGGRLKEDVSLADFPIDLGAEWIHEDPEVLNEMAGTNVLDEIDITTYNPRELLLWNGSELEDWSEELEGYTEWKFKDTTWFSFFETYIVPTVADNIRYEQIVASVDHTAMQSVVTAQNGETYTADHVIIAVPVTVLQDERITFTPPLPEDQREALDAITMSPGLKVFIEFSEQFYPEMLYLEVPDPEDPYAGRTFYDATFGKDTGTHVLGILLVGDLALPYIDQGEEEIIDSLLSELDLAFDGKATATYQDHRVQNWSQEPFIRGTYITDTTGWYTSTLKNASASVDNKIFFASGAFDLRQQGTVPGAARSARAAVAEITN